ncbi:MAG: FxsA family protein [Thermodesulfobacteriota bacterium]|nr:FxsA family protein [Thermodesulfobacteriota bacterium]
MFLKLFLLFTLVPFLELALLLKIGTKIGVLNTLMLIILTGILGAYLTRRAGFSVVFRIKSDLDQGKIPSEGIFHGVLVLIGGVLLITPGFTTDAVGFLLLMPGFRDLIKKELEKRVKRYIADKRIVYSVDRDV